MLLGGYHGLQVRLRSDVNGLGCRLLFLFPGFILACCFGFNESFKGAGGLYWQFINIEDKLFLLAIAIIVRANNIPHTR